MDRSSGRFRKGDSGGPPFEIAPNEPNKANLKTNVLNQEIELPCRESLSYISSQLNKGKNEFCISIEVNLDPGKINVPIIINKRGIIPDGHHRSRAMNLVLSPNAPGSLLTRWISPLLDTLHDGGPLAICRYSPKYLL